MRAHHEHGPDRAVVDDRFPLLAQALEEGARFRFTATASWTTTATTTTTYTAVQSERHGGRTVRQEVDGESGESGDRSHLGREGGRHLLGGWMGAEQTAE